MRKFKEFMKENYPFIIFGVIVFSLIYGFFYNVNRGLDLYERAINHAIESNTSIIIK